MNISLIVTTFVRRYGVVDGVDLSVAVPLVHTSVQGTSVRPSIPPGTSPHRFAGTDSAGRHDGRRGHGRLGVGSR